MSDYGIEPKKLLDLLVSESYITPEDVKSALDFERTQRGSALDFLFQQNILTNDIFGQAIAEYYKVPYADLNTHKPSKEQVLKIPETLAFKFNIVLFEASQKKVTIATFKPSDKNLKSELQKIFPKQTISVAYSLPEDVKNTLVLYRKKLATRFDKIIKQQQRVAPEIINEIFNDAIIFRASDIHFEPQEKEVVIRFRVDGVLQEAGRLPKQYYDNILNRIKVMARLRIDEHQATQDGAIRHSDTKGEKLDMRVSIVPTLGGEKVVLRLLARYVQGLGLDDLGVSEESKSIIEKVAKKPFGMILTTGPTGSGKTTTLYSLLKFLNRPDINITTIEDPVEYMIEGVNHIQVNQQTDLTFSKGLRSIVRQDPDVILVGEIRDQETAEIAVNAALTGHLLLSTFHSNDAATALPRLLEMGIEPFLLASTLELIIGQRLVRKICNSCKYSYKENSKKLETSFTRAQEYFGKNKALTLYKGKGCSVCGDTGYDGRMGIFESIEVTPEMQDLILTNPSRREIWKLARSQGSTTLFEDGIDKVKAGVTTLAEVLRVAEPPSLSE